MQQNGHIALVPECRAASMAKSEHLRRLASRMLLVAKRTKDPAIAESLSMQAGDLLAQAQDVEADAPTVPPRRDYPDQET